jgi:hypothetical protein
MTKSCCIVEKCPSSGIPNVNCQLSLCKFNKTGYRRFVHEIQTDIDSNMAFSAAVLLFVLAIMCLIARVLGI